MRIYGKFIGKLLGHTNDSPSVIEVYQTKTMFVFYAFNSNTMYWHNKTYLFLKYSVRIKNDIPLEEQLVNYIYSVIFHCRGTFSGKIFINDKELSFDKNYYINNATIGYNGKDIKGDIIYNGDYTDNGFCYKDLSAWDNNNGVIYISEYNLHIFDRQKKDITDSDCELWTKQSWVEYIKEYIEDNYSDCDEYQNMISSNEFIEKIAYDCLCNADWQDLSTIFLECEYDDDFILNSWYIFSNKN